MLGITSMDNDEEECMVELDDIMVEDVSQDMNAQDANEKPCNTGGQLATVNVCVKPMQDEYDRV